LLLVFFAQWGDRIRPSGLERVTHGNVIAATDSFAVLFSAESRGALLVSRLFFSAFLERLACPPPGRASENISKMFGKNAGSIKFKTVIDFET
jgi:hypothetical protein